MKNFTLVICFMLANLQVSLAQITTNPVKNSYVPYHQFLKQNNKGLQNGGDNTNTIINNEIAYRHDEFNTGAWAFYDSANYAYNTSGAETNGTLCTYSTANNWSNDTSHIYVYDQEGNLLTRLTKNWDAVNNCWITTDSLTTSYNAANKPLNQAYQIFANNKYWVNTTNNLYTYDANNNLIGQVSQIWNHATVSWLNTQQLTQTIGNNNLVVTQQIQFWDSASGTWANSTHTTYTYDSHNNQTRWIEQLWRSSQWIDFYKDSFVFDANNNLTALIYQEWDTANLSWINRSESIYTYDNNNNLAQYASYNWNLTNATWTPVFLNTYLYNTANKLLSETAVDWSTTTNSYVRSYQARYAYDGNNNLIEFADYYWGYQGTWVPNTSYNYTIDGNGKTIYELDQVYAPVAGAMVNTDQFFYYYSIPDATNGIRAIQNDLGAVLYPNPTSGNNINIALMLGQSSNLTLNTYDAQGKLINTGMHTAHNGANDLQISYPALSTGTYFIQVINLNTKATSVLNFVKN